MQRTIEDFQISERRILSRLKVHYLTDIYLHDEIIYSTALDISEGGIGMVIPHRLRLDETLNLRLNCNLNSDAEKIKKVNIFLKARVIWVSGHQEKNMYRTGLEITHINKDDFTKLRNHIRHLISKACEK